MVAITGVVVTPQGNVKPNARLYFTPASPYPFGYDGDVVLPDTVIVKANAVGAVSFSILPGNYKCSAEISTGFSDFGFYVDDVVSATFQDCMELGSVYIPPQVVQDVFAARDDAAASAASVDLGALDDAVTSSAASAVSSAASAVAAGNSAVAAAASAVTATDGAAATIAYATRAALIAATVPIGVNRVHVLGVGSYDRNDAATNPAATSNGGTYKWVPSGRATVKHYGALGDNSTNDTTAIQAAVTANAGGSVYFTAGTYLLNTWLNIESYTSLIGDGFAVLKVMAGAYTVDPRLVSVFASGRTNISFDGLIFDGNKGNIGAATLPLVQFYLTKNVVFRNCTFQNSQGIPLNVSTSNDGFTVDGCKFINVGRNPDGSEGTRTQAIAFSNTGGASETRTKNVRITNSYFQGVGLDCISLNNIDDAVISGNEAVDCYTFVYSNILPRYCRNIMITNNTVRNTTQGTLVSSAPPNAIDMPAVYGATIVGNTFENIACAAIGIFGGCTNIVVASNQIRNAGIHSQYQDMPWQGAIVVGGSGASASDISNVNVVGNLITDTLAIMRWGIILRADLLNCFVADNIVMNGTQGRYGRYAGNATSGNVATTALVDSSGVSATTIVQDVNFTDARVNNWRKVNSLAGFQYAGVDVLGSRKTGWGSPTGTATRATFATSTVTTAQLAERLKALIDDLTTHGMIGS